MKYTVVTTFHEQGLKQYGQRMIDSFEQFWPAEIDLVVCAENCQPQTRRTNTRVIDLLSVSNNLRVFLERHRNNPQAHGLDGPPGVFDPRKQFRWDAVRFCYKIYSTKLVSDYTDHGYLIWLDADTVTHSPIGLDDLSRLCPGDSMISYLGRGENYHSECGFVGYNLDHPATRNFITELTDMYNQDRIFELPEWHDSYVWDVVRRKYQTTNPFYNISGTLPKTGRAGHPFINSELGRFMDHLKGSRKTQGRSRSRDLIAARPEHYWQNQP